MFILGEKKVQHILEHPVFWDFQFTNHHEIFFPGQNSVGGTGSGAIVGMAVVSLRDRLNIHRQGDPFPTPRKKHAIFLSNVTVCQSVCVSSQSINVGDKLRVGMLGSKHIHIQVPKLLFTPVCAQGVGVTWTHPFLSSFP